MSAGIVDADSDIEGCRILLVEIIRRAAFDWVTYRSSTRLNKLALAEDAFTWLFVEAPGHPHWQEREGLFLYSFLGICEVLDLDPEYLRSCIKKLTHQHIQRVGRPKTVRRFCQKGMTRGSDSHELLLAEEISAADLEDAFPALPFYF